VCHCKRQDRPDSWGMRHPCHPPDSIHRQKSP
jgi:hypothetical protein